MSKRILRSAGSTSAQTLQTNKNYKLDNTGTLVEATSVGDDDIVFTGSKSSLRRISDIERNVSILAAKTLTDDAGAASVVSANKWTTPRTLSLAGDFSGNVTIDGSENVTLTAYIQPNTVVLGTDTTGNYMANVSAGTGISVSHTQGEGSTATISLNASTTNVSEGTNQYFTTARARGAVSAGTGISYNSSTGVITNTITQYTDALAVSANASAIATAKSEAISAAASDATTKANAAQAAAIAAVTNGAGAAFDTLKEIQDAMATDTELSAAIAAISNVPSATKLQTARTINGASFDGTANISFSTSAVSEGTNQYFTTARARGAVSAGTGISYNSSTGVITNTITNLNQLTNGPGFITGYTETDTLATVTGRGASTSSAISITNSTESTSKTTGALVVTGGVGIGKNLNVGGGVLTLLDATTPSSFWSIDASTYATGGNVFYRNATHNFTGTIVGTLSGNASTATTAGKWTTARTLSLTGDATGSMSVDGSANASAALTLANSGVTAGTYQSVTVDAKGRVTGGTNPGYVTSSGVTSIATSNGISGGTITSTGTLSLSGSYTGTWAVSGAITATGEVTAYFSDKRLKTNIVPIAEALDKVESISGYTFDPNETALGLGIEARHQMGVIAQEVEAVAPELVCDSAFAGYKTVRYDKLTALLIEAVKELSAKVKTLEAKLGDTKPQL